MLSPELLLRFVVLILSLSFHEAAHAFTSNRLGDPTARQLGRLTLNPLAHIDWIGTVLFPLIAMMSHVPLLGWAKPVPVDMRYLRAPRRDFAIVALAGPVSNMILAGGAAALLFVWPGARSGEAIGSVPVAFLSIAIEVNVVLAVFNLVPVPPLDGGNVLGGIVSEQVARLIDRLRPYGFIILYALMLTGILWQIIGPIAMSIILWLQ